jgi:hypothetical protein
MNRARIAAVVVALLAVAAIGLAAWLINTPHTTGYLAPPCTPCLGVSTPLESNVSGYNAYNFTVSSQIAGLTWSSVSLGLEDPNGLTIPAGGPGWNLSVRNAAGTLVAAEDIQTSNPAWTLGGSVGVQTGQFMILTSPPGSPLSGDVLSVVLGGGYSESLSVNIP